MPFTHLSDQELACVYMALLTYALSDRASADLCDEHSEGDEGPASSPLYRTGHQAHEEIGRRGLPRFGALLPRGVGFPFESWESFCRAIREESGST